MIDVRTSAGIRSVTGGRAVVEALVACGVDHAYCVPGESFLGLLDALQDDDRIRVVSTRHEGAASFMAEAHAKLTHRPAVCLATRMVGAANLAIGIHTAQQDSTPLIAILGQVRSSHRHRESFQEAELTEVYRPITKWAVEPVTADRLAEVVMRAGYVARSGRPGPVAIAIREELFDVDVPEPRLEPLEIPRTAPDPSDAAAALESLRSAARPLLIVGEEVLRSNATADLVRLAELEQLAVIASWRRPDAFPNNHPHYLGHAGYGAPPSVWDRLLEADVVLVLGARIDEVTSREYDVPTPASRVIHVVADSDSHQGERPRTTRILSDVASFVRAMVEEARRRPADPAHLDRHRGRIAAANSEWNAQTTPRAPSGPSVVVDQEAVVAALRAQLPADAILTTDAGNFSGWAARYYRWSRPGTFLGPTSGAMGYGIPAAIGAALAAPGHAVVALVGDGGFLMTGAELETAVRENAKIIALVHDNQQYGTIRMHQLRRFPGRPIATALGPVDFAGFARSLGARGFSVTSDSDIAPTLAEAMAADGPSVIHLRVDPEQISVASPSRGPA